MKHLFNPINCISQEQIERYLNNEINPEERFRVENHLLDCELCNNAVDGFAAMEMNEDDVTFLNRFKSELESKKEQEPQAIVRTLEPRNNRLIFNRIAAAIMILAIPLSVFLYQNNNQNVSLANDYSNIDNFFINPTGRGPINEAANKDADLKNALNNFKEKRYEASIPQFEAYLERSPENAEVILYTGIASLESGLYQKADDLLTTVRINEERYFEDATWYLVLSKIKTSKTTEAVGLLDELIKKNESGFYADKAKELLKKIKR